MEEEVRRMQQTAALAADRVFYNGVAIPQRRDADAAQQVEVVVAILIRQVDVMSTDEEIGIPFICLQKQLALCRLKRCQCVARCQFHATCTHATMTSVPSFTRVEQRSGSSAAASAGRMRTRFTPWVSASRQ